MWRRPLTVTVLIAAALVCQGCLEISSAGLRAPALDNSDRRWFARSCESLWPDAVRTLTSQGFRLVGRDAAGGIASFMWADERRLGRLRATRDLEEFILPEAGGARDLRNARIETAVLEAGAKKHGCEVRLRISYAVPRSAFGMKRGWISLESSGRFEERLLAMLAQSDRLAHRPPNRDQASVQAHPAVAVRTLRVQPASASAADEAGVPDTRVVRLDGEN